MKKLSKIIVGLCIVVLVLIVGLGMAVRSILTEENIKDAVVSKAESFLGRKVSMGKVTASLTSGITLQNFVVKEEDGVTDFLRIKAVVLQYNLGTLLDKELQINELLIQEPVVRVIKNKDGNYNFSSLVDSANSEPVGKTDSTALALPLALIVDTINLQKISVNFQDAEKQIPDFIVLGNLKVGGELGVGSDSWVFYGDANFTVDAFYGELAPKAKLSVSFDQANIQYSATISVDQEQALFQGEVVDYMGLPDVTMDISSKQLNLKYLAGIAAALPEKAKDEQQNGLVSDLDKSRSANSLASVKAHGKITLLKALYEQLEFTDFQTEYSLQDGVLLLKDLKAATAGGTVEGQFTMDLNKYDPSYQGSVSGQSLDITEIGRGLGKDFAEVISGSLQTNATFSGQGFASNQIKKNLSMQTDYSLLDGQLQNTKLTEDLAEITGLPELQTVSFKDITGKIKLLTGGKILVDTVFHNKDFSASTDGTVDVAGKLKLPVVVRVSPEMVEKIGHKDLSRYLVQENGETIVHLDVGGSLERPVVALDKNYFKKVVHKAVVDQIFHHLDKYKAEKEGQPDEEQDPEKIPIEPVLDLLNNFLRR